MDSVLQAKRYNHYYGDFSKQSSNSDIITLLNDPKSFRKPKEMSKAMLLGRYFHTAMLEPHKIEVAKRQSHSRPPRQEHQSLQGRVTGT